jgi:mycothione reductase
VEGGTFGGTCLNVGCIPTKMYVVPADLAATPVAAARLGVDLSFVRTRWEDLRDRVFGRIDALSASGAEDRRADPRVTLYRSEAEFVGERTLRLAGGEQVSADRFVIAAGSRPVRPPIPGLERVEWHTSDTIMRLDGQPGSVAIIGGGYVAAEFAHIFSALGTRVSVLVRSDAMMRSTDGDVSRRFTQVLAERVDLRLHTKVSGISRGVDGRAHLHLMSKDRPDDLEADVVLVATGREPNGRRLGVERAGVALDEQGFVVVDGYQRTSAEGIYALGDVSSPRMLKHVANQDARVVRHNLLHPDNLVPSDHRFIPQGVFSDPQVASVGATEEELRGSNRPYLSSLVRYADTAYGWALEDTTSFCKVLGEPETGRLLGAHIIGPQATSLLQPLIHAMTFGQRAKDVARGQYWPHPALTEVVEKALLGLVPD